MLCVEDRARVSIGPMNRKLQRGNLARAQKDVEELKRERFLKRKKTKLGTKGGGGEDGRETCYPMIHEVVVKSGLFLFQPMGAERICFIFQSTTKNVV